MEIEGAQQLINGLNRIVKDLIEDNKLLLEPAGEAMLAGIGKNFIREGRPVKWVALSARTQKERKYQGYNPTRPILQRTGQLMKSASTRGGLGNYWEMKKDELIIACLISYAAKLHSGDETTNLPARPFFFIQDQDVKDINKAMGMVFVKKIQEYLKG